ncbi:hypothetical protein TNCV_2723571 [Trichonephila clavipes]|nr:hypothetical protein TNCV_2723571 [Trichonephila clavipes]
MVQNGYTFNTFPLNPNSKQTGTSTLGLISYSTHSPQGGRRKGVVEEAPSVKGRRSRYDESDSVRDKFTLKLEKGDSQNARRMVVERSWSRTRDRRCRIT